MKTIFSKLYVRYEKRIDLQNIMLALKQFISVYLMNGIFQTSTLFIQVYLNRLNVEYLHVLMRI